MNLEVFKLVYAISTEMKCTVGKEPEGGSKKRKEVGNVNSLVSMFEVTTWDSIRTSPRLVNDTGWQDLRLLADLMMIDMNGPERD